MNHFAKTILFILAIMAIVLTAGHADAICQTLDDGTIVCNDDDGSGTIIMPIDDDGTFVVFED